MTLAYCVDLEEEGGEDVRQTRRIEAQTDALAERVEDVDVPLTTADIRAALRLMTYQGGMAEWNARVARITIILRARCVNARRKSVAATT
jgi:G:T/U-mismatch repair DNA glycosylase